jgi:hypothetical protein
VKIVKTSPKQAIKPRISRTGLIGIFSATIGLAMSEPIDSNLALSASFQFRQPASNALGLPNPLVLD